MARQNNKSLRDTVKKAPAKTIHSVLTGGILSSDFFFRHMLKIFVLGALLMFYISTKYQSMTGMESIRRLEKQLEVVKTERIRERSRYMSRIRESSMATLADSVRPGLSIQQQPPFVLHMDDD
ncbi:MAG: hypothetical protein J1F20_07920 [Muribaculaceae bacterium]|nr:hypothetical protein [Muribaculaceae bacterium]